jgi:tRNA threonylcarbamoyladenosine biosynthesis protein TsaB
MSLILNIESATDICSIAISRDNELLGSKELVGNLHAEKMTLLINECLAACNIRLNDLDAIAISNGPGSYTSLRIGASTAKGLCYALDLPLIAIDTLETLALAAFNEIGDKEALYCPMIDARRMEVYTATYQYSETTGALENIEPMHPKIIDGESYSDFLQKNKKIYLCGNGAEKTSEVLSNSYIFILPIECSARYLYILSNQAYVEKRFEDMAYHTPQYLKAPNITTPKSRL